MPRYRQKSHWERKPYHPIIDDLVKGDVVLWGSKPTPRVIRSVNRNPYTDHVYSIDFIKIRKSGYPCPTTTYCRYELKRDVHRRIGHIDEPMNETDELTQACIDVYDAIVDAYHRGDLPSRAIPRLDRCVTQDDVVGVIY